MATFDYTDIRGLSVSDATGFVNRAGAGTSWGASLGEFPVAPIFMTRVTSRVMNIYNFDTLWKSLITNVNDYLFRQNNLNYGILFTDFYKGRFCNAGQWYDADGSMIVDLNENMGAGANKTGFNYDRSTAGKSFDSTFVNANTAAGHSFDSEWNRRWRRLGFVGKFKFLVDGNGVEYFLWSGNSFAASDTCLISRNDLSQTINEYGHFVSSDVHGTNSEAVTLTNPSSAAEELCVYGSGTAISVVYQANWSIFDGLITSDFKISGTYDNSANTKWRLVSLGDKLIVGGDERVGVIDNTVLTQGYSGTKSIDVDLRGDGVAYNFGCATTAKPYVDHTIVDDIFKGADWRNVSAIKGTYLVLVATTAGLFCVDVEPATPLYRGHLTTAAATDFFEDFDLLTDNTILEADGVWIESENTTTVVFNNAAKGYAYEIAGPPLNWPYTGLTQPTIVYNSITVSFPKPVSCTIAKLAVNKVNIGLDKTEEVVNQGYPSELIVRVYPIYDATFKSEMKAFFDDWGGQGKWFEFTSGQNARYDGNWLLKDRELKPKIGTAGQLTYEMKFWRPYG